MNRPHEDPPGLIGAPLHAALLAYARYPGKYPAALRQPPELFASIREIIQLAIGRESATSTTADPDAVAVHSAACFFVRTAMLSPDADHYVLLGLDRTVDNAALKDRYRILMRLLHPDFSDAGATQWPAEAAVRVNMAYEVLSSAVRRRDYDAALARVPERPLAAKPAHQRITPPQRANGLSRAGYSRLIAACGVAGALVLISLLMSGREGVQLVQRETPAARPAVVVAQETVAAPAPALALPLAPPAPPVAAAQVRKAPAQQVPPQQPTAPLAVAERARPIAVPAAPRATMPSPAPAPAAVAAPARPLPQAVIAVVPARVEPPPPTPAPAPAPAADPAVAPVQVARAAAPTAAAAPAPAVSVPPAPVITVSAATPAPPLRQARPAPVRGPSLAEIQPLLSVLLQQLESGRGDRLINLLDREARNQPGPQALSRFYDNFTEGIRPVRLSHVEFKAEPAEGRLLVIGNIGLQLGEPMGSVNKRMTLRAEFSSRDGSIVMTGLSGGHGY